MDLETHRKHAAKFIWYYCELVDKYPNDWICQRGFEIAHEYASLLEDDPLDVERIQRLAVVTDVFQRNGSAALDMDLHIQGLLAGPTGKHDRTSKRD